MRRPNPSSPSPALAGREQRGQAAESLVETYLVERGYEILGRNIVFKKLGELDIVARRQGVICFVEVRSRRDATLGDPAETVGFKKQRQLRKLAKVYLERGGITGPARFDVASVVWRPEPKVRYIENAFSDGPPPPGGFSSRSPRRSKIRSSR